MKVLFQPKPIHLLSLAMFGPHPDGIRNGVRSTVLKSNTVNSLVSGQPWEVSEKSVCK